MALNTLSKENIASINAFCESEGFLKTFRSSIKTLSNEDARNEFYYQAKKHLHSIKSELLDDLVNPNIGIVAVDIPSLEVESSRDQSLASFLVSHAISSLFMDFDLDIQNSTPFSIHTASINNSKLLSKNNLESYTPEKRLGFHSDGKIRRSGLYIPKFISLYNMVIAYSRPGNFYWLPIAEWRELDRYFSELGYDKTFELKTTDSVYKLSKDDIAVDGAGQVKCPLFIKNEHGKPSVFYNGQVIPQDNHEKALIEQMLVSLQENSSPIVIEQKCNRLLIMNNLLGLHARDIFEEPLYSSPEEYTRVFFRSVSSEELKVTTNG